MSGSPSVPQRGRTLAIMFTMTTYGTWLRGDRRGWVDGGRILPSDPDLQRVDRQRMKHDPYLFPRDVWLDVGAALGISLIERVAARILALTIQSWHVHFVIAATPHDIGDVAKCAKDAVRYALKPGRPIWSAGYDKRFCFDEPSVVHRVRYVERHNTESGLPARPWSFITPLD